MGRSTIDPRTRAEFKEAARNIVLRDRQAKKLGRTQNTIGEIERAMVWAFKFGQEEGHHSPLPTRDPNSALDWEEVPPRSRQTLDDMVWQPAGYNIEKPIGLRPIEVDGRERWERVYLSGRDDSRPIHPGGVNPLRRLGVLEPSKSDPQLLVLSVRGQATCEAYLARSMAQDSSLPPMNLRV